MAEFMTREQMRRSSVPYIAALLSQLVGEGRHLVPLPLLPIADCQNCEYMKIPHDDGHCYMFLVKPDGNHCGQMKASVKPRLDREGRDVSDLPGLWDEGDTFEKASETT